MTRPPLRAAVIAPTDQAYGREIALGFSTAAERLGWIAQLYDATEGIAGSLREWDPRIIVLGASRAYRDIPEDFLGSRVLVATECDRPDLIPMPKVMVDDAAVGRLAAEHFAEQGIRTVATLGYKHPGFVVRRTPAFAERAAELGLRFLGYWDQLPNHWDTGGASPFEPLRDWLMAANRPVGLCCLCDNWGRRALTGLRSVGVRIPEDVAMLGVDNDESLCDLVQPPLSSVDIPWDRMGAAAATLAERALRGEPHPAQPLLIPPTGVVRRRSTDVLAVDDPDVVEAVRFIRRRATEQPIRIADILHEVAAGRHRLHRAFREQLGRTIMQEVRRVRVEHAKRLITTTPLSLDAIAHQSGFPSYRKLTLAFRAETGATPSEYRKRFP